MLSGYVVGGIRELWRSATALCGGRRGRRAGFTQVDASRLREGVRGRAGAKRDPHAGKDLLAQGLESLGADTGILPAHDVLRAYMEQICVACAARSRCRRDLATGDFARRYRHYCPNAGSLARLAMAGRA